MRWLALALLCLIAFPANAMTCRDVRAAVATYGQATVEGWARSQGYSEQFIREARKCLKVLPHAALSNKADIHLTDAKSCGQLSLRNSTCCPDGGHVCVG